MSRRDRTLGSLRSIATAGDQIGRIKHADAALYASGQGRFENMGFDLANDVHLTWLTVELQRQYFVAVHQLHVFYFSDHTGNAFGLLRTEVEREAQAVLGDHHWHIAGFGVGFKGWLNQLYTKALVECAGVFVINVIEE